ncbi:hypothetical protein [Sinanaerobacter sp. ZZT-01]|uniref:hypothetical protein n=1 Tax=Sinanaerobacter sp. ZZT-01 TaxID=3111540 RepID=UPI002D78E802|nr:hypothetical protein [Sinanaerobacter sp. ZZT-01]WRR94216.1 hypothetical protein U5921_03595 [Sinanaerobacter sp. ZZT-01]
MAVVMEYTTSDGTTIKINDEAYRDKTEEELQRVRENIHRVASRLFYDSMCSEREGNVRG